MSNNSFKIKNSAVLTPKDLSTLVSPEAGEIACDINDSNKIKRYDAASSSWVEVGSGGVGSVDIMFVQDFESSSLSSFTQTGLSLSTTNPLHGKVSALLTHQAAVNQSFKQVVAVDPKFRGQAMVLDLNIKSAASAGNVVIKVRDESNSADLIVSEALQLSSSVSGRRSSVSFTIPSTCSSLSYTITALPEAGSPVTRIDDIVSYLGDVALLETSVEVPVMTAWQGYTPTFQGFGTPSNIEFEWRQVGENVEIRGKFTAGTPTGVEARVTLPAGLSSAGTSIIPSLQVAGSMATSYFSGTYFSYISLIEPSVSYMTMGVQVSSIAALAKATGSQIASTGTVISFSASIPCAGLSATTTKTIPLTQSGLVQEGDSYLRATGSTIDGSGRITALSVAQSLGNSFIIDTSAGYVKLKVTENGIYNVTFISDGTSSSLDRQNGILINGVGAQTQRDIGNGAGEGFSIVNSLTRYLTTTDEVTFTISGSSARTYILTATSQGSLKQVSVSSDQKITIPTSELRFEGASSRGSTATAIVKFDTMAKLRGDAFTVESDSVLGTRITMKKAGKLDISASLAKSAVGFTVAISKNQQILTSFATASELISISGSSATSNNCSVSSSVYVNIGDIFRIVADQVPTANIGNILNLSFQEQDISVSVTNTLPQFSDSDSSVRVNTANGYGSTASNKIRRFSSVVENLGSDITYLDDSANGATFTIMSSGVYNITYTDQFSAQCLMGLSKNASSLTSAIQSLSASQILSVTNSVSANQPESVSWQGYLSAGDIIRPHSEGTSSGTTTSAVNFTISKVGKPNVTGVNVTPFVNLPQPESNYYSASDGSAAGAAAALIANFSGLSASGSILSQTSSRLTALKKCEVDISWGWRSATGSGNTVAVSIYKNGSLYFSGGNPTNNTFTATASVRVPLDIGEYLELRKEVSVAGCDFVNYRATATALSDQILTAPESFSTDTASLSYASSAAYTLSTLQNAPVGTFITFTYAANTNTRTQTVNTPPSQSTADMNTNGIQMFARTYNAVSTAAQPAAVAIQIGKGLKGKSLDLYKSSGKATAGSLDYYTVGSGASGALVKDYNEVTGILVIDCGVVDNTVTSAHNFNFSDVSSQASGYLVINASKNPALTGVPLLQPRIATLRDVKASGTNGGTATSGSYQTRTLNTLSDPSGIVTSLASNQFVLPAGEYYIEANAPAVSANAVDVSTHKAKLRNITDSTDLIMGTTSFSDSSSAPSNGSLTYSYIAGVISISSAKTFEIQHRTSATAATVGFGIAAAFGDDEVYTVVKIQKIK
jgi:hypothetical protein